MQRSSPEARPGLSRFDASIEPPVVAPAPTMVWISSMNRMAPGVFFTPAMTPFSRCSNSPRNLVPARSAPMSSEKIFASSSSFGHALLVDGEREPLDDGGLADARLAHEDRVVLAAAAQHLDGALDLGAAPDERVDEALRRPLVQVDGEACGTGRAPCAVPPRRRPRPTRGPRRRRRRRPWRCRARCRRGCRGGGRPAARAGRPRASRARG